MIFENGTMMMIPHGWTKKCSLCGKWSLWWDEMKPPKGWPESDCRGCFGGIEDEVKRR